MDEALVTVSQLQKACNYCTPGAGIAPYNICLVNVTKAKLDVDMVVKTISIRSTCGAWTPHYRVLGLMSRMVMTMRKLWIQVEES